MTKRLLVILPTRGRPERLEVAMQTLLASKSHTTDVCVVLDGDDHKLPQYEELIPSRRTDVWAKIIPRNGFGVIPKVNAAVDLHPDYAYYSVANDDFAFETPKWDEKLIDVIETYGNGWGVATPNSKFTENNWHEHRHPCSEIVSGNIVRVLGHYFTPLLRHHGADTYLRDLAESIGRYWYLPNVVVRHDHPQVTKEKGKPFSVDGNHRDGLYVEAYKDSEVQYFERQFKLWNETMRPAEVKNLCDAMGVAVPKERRSSVIFEVGVDIVGQTAKALNTVDRASQALNTVGQTAKALNTVDRASQALNTVGQTAKAPDAVGQIFKALANKKSRPGLGRSWLQGPISHFTMHALSSKARRSFRKRLAEMQGWFPD